MPLAQEPGSGIGGINISPLPLPRSLGLKIRLVLYTEGTRRQLVTKAQLWGRRRRWQQQKKNAPRARAWWSGRRSKAAARQAPEQTHERRRTCPQQAIVLHRFPPQPAHRNTTTAAGVVDSHTHREEGGNLTPSDPVRIFSIFHPRSPVSCRVSSLRCRGCNEDH